MKLLRFIGVAGTNGSGKDTLGRVLEHHGYRDVSLSNILRAEATKRGLDHTREHLSSISHELRTKFGEGILPQRLIDETLPDEKLVITSVRTPGEVAVIQENGGIVVWVDADQRERYRRILAAHRDRPTDEVSFEEFQRQEAAEMMPTKEGGGLNMSAVREAADATILNDFASKEEFIEYLQQYFEV